MLVSDCEVCIDRRLNGRQSLSSPIHCHRCHTSWTGNEAQHCTKCCRTFYSVIHSDRHDRRNGCLDPTRHPDWSEARPGVWIWRKPEDGESPQDRRITPQGATDGGADAARGSLQPVACV